MWRAKVRGRVADEWFVCEREVGMFEGACGVMTGEAVRVWRGGSFDGAVWEARKAVGARGTLVMQELAECDVRWGRVIELRARIKAGMYRRAGGVGCGEVDARDDAVGRP